MPEGLKIQVAADVQQAVKALGTDVPKAADKTAAAFSSMTQTVSSASQVLSKTVDRSANNANSAITALANTIKTKGAAGFTVLGEAGQLAGSKLRSLSGVMASTASQVPALTSSVNTSAISFKNLALAFGVAGLAAKILGGLFSQIVEGLTAAFNGSNKLASASKLLANSQAQAVISTKEEVVQLQVLFAVAKDASNTYVQRKAAIDEINRSYPQFHKNLTLEAINTLAVADAVNEVVNSLIKKAQLQGLVTTIADMSNKLEGYKKVFNSIKEIPVRNVIARDIKTLTNNINELTQAAIKLQTQVIGKGSAAGVLGGLVQTSIGKEIGRPSETVNVPEARINVDKIKIKPKVLEIDNDLATPFDIKDDRSRFKKQLDELGAKLNLKIPIGVDLSTPGKGFQNLQSKAEQDRLNIFKKITADANLAAQTITDVLAPAFNGLFDAIVKGEDPLKAFFKGIIQSVVQLIQKLITAAITASILSALIPGGGGGVGSILGKLLGGVKPFANGGLITGPQLSLLGEGPGTSRSNPEVVAPLDKLKGMLAGMSGGGLQTVLVTGRLRGNDMLLQNARTSRSQRRTTGR